MDQQARQERDLPNLRVETRAGTTGKGADYGRKPRLGPERKVAPLIPSRVILCGPEVPF